MSTHAVHGWCPSAWRPMMAGDGLLVRVRPRLARLTIDQVLGLCEAAAQFGSDVIDLTNRANLQIRGVSDASWPRLIERLVALDLVDPSPAAEGRCAILTVPDWMEGDDSVRIANGLMTRRETLPDLPAKFGLAIDAGRAPMLAGASADLRIERSERGALMLRADGRETGVPVTVDEAAEALAALARWFVDTGGGAAGRMARHGAPLPGWAEGKERPAPARAPIRPGRHVLGYACGVAFGSTEASALADLMLGSGAQALRITPWRVLLLEGGEPGWIGNFIHEASHPTLCMDACPGAPACPQATVETRGLAARLSPHVAGRLHVSGCAKGCARHGPADVVLTGRQGSFDLAFGARAGEGTARSGLAPHQLLAHFGAC